MPGRALDRAAGFLRDRQEPQGWWADFHLDAGPSTVWVTAYVGTALAGLPDAPARSAAMDAWDFLARWQGQGWGYNLITPNDADSTAWALGMGLAVGARDTAAWSEGWQALQTHVQPDGGLATYAAPGAIARFIGAEPDDPLPGWCTSSTCVTAAAAALGLPLPGLAQFLRDRQCPDGRWQSYWWGGDAYATALAARALAATGTPGDRVRVARACDWVLTQIGDGDCLRTPHHPDGAAFDTGLALQTLALAPDRGDAAARRLARWLERTQRADGSWPGSARLQVTPPDVTDPNRFDAFDPHSGKLGGVSADQNRVFTTATALAGLHALRAVSTTDTSALQ